MYSFVCGLEGGKLIELFIVSALTVMRIDS
jgi:hypothetical protein